MVISHRSRAYRGNGPDSFAPTHESNPSYMGRTTGWTRTDEPDWNVQVCRECDFATGIQCKPCKAIRAGHRGKEE